MKKGFILLLIVILSLQAGYSQIRSKVDERFELTSTVFALAGVPAYCQCDIPSYWKDINTELTPYELTEPINFIRELNQIHAISYDAVSTTAAMLEIKNGKIRLQRQYDISKISEVDSRWNEELLTKYIQMLNVFYKQSKFHQFFEKHRVLYDVAEQRMDQLLAGTVMTWFESFFGKPFDPNMNIYISLCNGPNNYSIPDGVLIGLLGDAEGLPNAEPFNTMPVLIHEIAHHYTNDLFVAYWPEMEAAANKMYPYVKDRMAQLAYGSAQSMLGEWMNNLFCLMYSRETGDVMLDILLCQLTDNGFIWTPRGMEFMDNFYAHRDRYPHIDDFMPQLIAFLNYTADNYDFVIREHEHRQPYITEVYPAMDSDISGFEEIVVSFSEPMHGAYGFNGRADESSKSLFFKDVKWSEDYRKLTFILSSEEAEPNQTYSIQLHPRFFRSARYVPLDDRCKNLIFNTIKK